MFRLTLQIVAVLALLGATLAAPLQGGAATMVIKTDFETDPVAAGWVATPAPNARAHSWSQRPSGEAAIRVSPVTTIRTTPMTM